MVIGSTHPRRRAALALAAVTSLVLLVSACSGGSDETAPVESGSAAASAAGAAPGNEVLLDKQSLTTLDQPIQYPRKGSAEISSVVVTLEPGQETGWHRHKVPLYVHVLEGTVSVEYDAGVVKDYAAGSTFMEAQGVWHNGTNKGDDPVKILTVYLGSSGVKNNTVERTP